jgi:hypothetical protein
MVVETVADRETQRSVPCAGDRRGGRSARVPSGGVIPISVSGGTVMAVFLMAVIVLGYVVIWALWHFVFREAGDHAPPDGSDDPPA